MQNHFKKVIKFRLARSALLHFQDCYFNCEYHAGFIALRDARGLYLAPIGSRAILKTRSVSVTKDEYFSLEDSLPQASFVASSNTRYVSVKQGNDDAIDNDPAVASDLTCTS